MIQKNLIIILGTEPRILCSEVIRKNNSSMTQLSDHPVGETLSNAVIKCYLILAFQIFAN